MIYDIRYSIRQDKFRHLIDALVDIRAFEGSNSNAYTRLPSYINSAIF